VFRVELFPLGFMGRSFQLLALSIDPSLVKELRYDKELKCDIVEFNSVNDFLNLVREAKEYALALLEKGFVSAPQMFGNDYKPVQAILGRDLKDDEKKRWDIAVELVVEKLLSGNVSLDEPMAAPMNIMKLNIFEMARTMRGGRKPSRTRSRASHQSPCSGINVVAKMTPASFTLALIGGLMSKIGRVGDKGVYVIPTPEAGQSDLYSIGLLYTLLNEEASDSSLVPLGRLLGAGGLEEAPTSLDVLLLVYSSAILAEALGRDAMAACTGFMALDPRLDLFMAATVTETGNRAILNQLLPLNISEVFCRLGYDVLTSVASALWRSARRGLCTGERGDPGRDAVFNCVGRLFLYSVTDNDVYLYDCARMLRGAADSKECQGTPSRLLVGLASVVPSTARWT
jgi:hypothetical protein